ncbi:MAG: SufD family Fe-S cluster assembly protein [Candidatus Bathyarchaeota archaeon]|nr:SufD family Fe-S cluster assembly protein [Candidatus Bathyarchaeota archaeon]
MEKKNDLKSLPHQILQEALRAGLDLTEENRSGTLLHVDQSTIYSKANELLKGKIELIDTKIALKKYPWLEDYRWKLVDRNKDEFTKKVSGDFSGGYFMRILPNAEIIFPIQSCLMITQKNLEQRVHNIIIAEEGSKSHIITSCTQHLEAGRGSHLGISEIYVKKGASLNFTMIHNWSKETHVRPRSAAQVEDNGKFVSNYICLEPVRDVQMYPVAFCNGMNSKASLNSILYGCEDTNLDVGSRAVLNGKGSKAELITRAIAKKGANLIVRGMIEGNNSDSKGHLECRGLIVDENSLIYSIPELIARRRGCEITHEAAVGKISEKEIMYLMSRKIPRDQAISMIIRGFMDVGIMGLPKALSEEVSRVIDLVAEAS